MGDEEEGDEVLAAAPVPEAVEITITIVGTQYNVNIRGGSAFELPTRLRIAAHMVEQQLGINVK